MKIKLLFAALVALLLFAHNSCLYSEQQTPNNLAVLTVPKSGSSLLAKAIFLISKTHPVLGRTVPIGNNRVLFHHLWPGLESLRSSPDWKKIIFIRDPRDVLVSMKYWIEKTKDWGGGILSASEIQEFLALSDDEKLTCLILFPERLQGVPYFSETALRWMCEPGVVTFRFEDLVGDQGGGARMKQLNTLHSLASLLGFPLTQEESSSIADSLFGDSATFRIGAIGSWRHEFKQHHKQLFKDKIGLTLIRLGYENNDDW